MCISIYLCPPPLQVVDVNENHFSPVFASRVFNGSVEENAAPHTHVITVAATDADTAPLDSAVSYSLVGREGRGLFYINQLGEYDIAEGGCKIVYGE